MYEENKSRLNSGNAYYHSVQKLLYSSLLSKNMIFAAVIYGCEIWSLTLREKYRLRMFENRLLRKIFGWKRDNVTGEWRELHRKKLQDMCSTQNIIQVIKPRTSWTGFAAHTEQKRGAYRVLVGKLEGKRPFGRPRHR
jgi:hypothetical protein